MWNRLGVKATAVVVVVTVVCGAVIIGMSLRAQQAYLTAEVVRGAAQFSDTIKASTYHFMQSDERAGAYRTMEMIGRLEGIEQVRMLNKEGRVTFSTDQAEIGRLVDKRAESCYACHAAGQPLVRLNVPSRSAWIRCRPTKPDAPVTISPGRVIRVSAAPRRLYTVASRRPQ